MICDSAKYICQILVRVNLVGFACFNQAVNDSRPITTCVTSKEQVIFSTHRNATHQNLRPGQIQECLEKLSRHTLIDHTTVVTDGYENYRLTDTGSHVLTMWEQHRARA